MAEPRPAFVSPGELFGGVERHLLGMCTWMLRQGREPLLLLFHDRELARQAREIGVEPMILPTRGSYDIQGPRRLGDILAAHKVNVVHAHGYRAMVNAALAGRYHHFAVVRTVHGLQENRSLFSLAAWKSRGYGKMEQWATRKTGASVCFVTRDLELAHARANKGQRCLTIYNGIDPLNKADYSRPPDLPEGKFHCGVVGRVSQIKGLDYAIRALALLGSDSPIELNVIGTGPLEAQLKALSLSLNLADKVKFLGFKENIFDYLAFLDALLMPSLHEGLPYSILEALSLGTPIIASRTGGLGEILTHGETAHLIRVGDVAGLAGSMAEFSANPELVRGLARAGRALQTEQLNLDKMGHTYWREYEKVLN